MKYNTACKKKFNKTACALLFCALAFFSLLSTPARAAIIQGNGAVFGGEISSLAYIVINAETGQTLYAENENTRMYPASVTKLLTLALAMEKCQGDYTATVTATEECVVRDYTLSHIAIQPGEVFSLEQLFYAAQLMSANDAANALAIYVGGNLQGFEEIANAKLTALGCTGSYFTNPSGIPDQGHYTTAADIARIAQYALSVPGMAALMGAVEYTIPPTNLQSESRLLGTSNLMVVTSKYYYEGVIGGKDGWTQEAGHTLVTVAEQGGQTLICVVLGAEHKYADYKDAHALLNAAFGNFEVLPMEISCGGQTVPVTAAAGPVGTITITGGSFTMLSVPKGTAATGITATYNIAASYEDGAAINPTVSYTLAGEDEPFCTVPLAYTIAASAGGATAANATAANATPLPAGEDGSTPTISQGAETALKAATATLVLLAFAYAQATGAAMRKNAKRRHRLNPGAPKNN